MVYYWILFRFGKDNLIQTFRYAYYRILRKPIQKILNPKYEG